MCHLAWMLKRSSVVVRTIRFIVNGNKTLSLTFSINNFTEHSENVDTFILDLKFCSVFLTAVLEVM